MRTEVEAALKYATGGEQQVASTAYHEAGHAVIAIHFGIRLGKKGVTVIPGDDYLGCVHFLNKGYRGSLDDELTDKKRGAIERRVMVSLAGIIAQQHFDRKSLRSFHASSDYQSVLDLLIKSVGSAEEAGAWCKFLHIRTRLLITAPHMWERVARLAGRLIVQKTLTPDEARSACFGDIDLSVSVSAPKIAKRSLVHK